MSLKKGSYFQTLSNFSVPLPPKVARRHKNDFVNTGFRSFLNQNNENQTMQLLAIVEKP